MIRTYAPEDMHAIEKLHQNPAYQMPKLDHPLMLVRKVQVDEHDRPRMAAFGRLHLEALLFVDHTWLTPAARLEKLKELQQEMVDEARALRLDIATTQADGRFSERLQEDLGWIKGWGNLYYRQI